jgi:hypothetical protein
MSTTIELFDLYKRSLALTSDLAAARKLGIKAQTVSNWRTRGSQAEPWLIVAMCEHLEDDPMRWLLAAQSEQAHDPANQMVWRRLATKLGMPLSALAFVFHSTYNAIANVAISPGEFTDSLRALELVAMRAERVFVLISAW